MRKPSKIDKDDKKADEYHKEDERNVLAAVRKSLLANYPGVFTDSPSATPLSVYVNWDTHYQGSPIIQSVVTYAVMPETAEQETVYYVTTTAGRGGADSWTRQTSASRMSETWEPWLLPIGFIPIPGRSDWPRTFCFLRLGKDSNVGRPADTIKTKRCIRDLVFDPKVDGDVLAAAIMRAVNGKRRADVLDALAKEGGAK